VPLSGGAGQERGWQRHHSGAGLGALRFRQ
jgi:hypothetical protein